MDCKTFGSLVEPGLINEALKKAFGEEIERHLQSCAVRRERYALQLESDNNDDRVIPDTAKTKAVSPSVDDLLDPVEFKDGPVTFTLHLDGRKEEIKVVEPKVDFPLPVGGRLVVRENEARLTDDVFRFHPEKELPYELHFTAKAGVSYGGTPIGDLIAIEKNLNPSDRFSSIFHALIAVPGHGMGHLLSHYRRRSVLVLRNRQDAGRHCHLNHLLSGYGSSFRRYADPRTMKS